MGSHRMDTIKSLLSTKGKTLQNEIETTEYEQHGLGGTENFSIVKISTQNSNNTLITFMATEMLENELFSINDKFFCLTMRNKDPDEEYIDKSEEYIRKELEEFYKECSSLQVVIKK